MAEIVSVQQIVGANIKALRLARRPKITQHQFADALKETYGVEWAKQGMYRVENGEREVNPDEMVALADFFDVPIWHFFTPSADFADSEIVVGGEKRPAWSLLTDMLKPEKPTHQLAFRAYSVAVDLERMHGSDNEALIAITEALGNNNFPGGVT